MTDLEKIRTWIKKYPGFELLGDIQCDYTDRIPSNGAVFPTGIVEISRTEDILGNVIAQNQYNFGLYYVFYKSPGDDVNATFNADWIMDFQKWVQEQSIRKLTPIFGDIDTDNEIIRAQNGVLYESDESGVATYVVQLSVEFKKYYEVI